MKKSLSLMVNGKPFEVVIDDQGGMETTVMVNGVAYAVRQGGQESPAVSVSRAPAAAPVLARRAVPAAAGAANVLTAPMPGVIQGIAVKAGDQVARGDLLCALEAMKMKNAIRAPRDAEIASVEVHEGQKVLHGDVLIRFV